MTEKNIFVNLVEVSCNFIKKNLKHKYFPVLVAKFLRIAFFIEHLR